MLFNLNQQEAFLAFCLAIASQDNELNEKERAPLINGMKKAKLLDSEYELKKIFNSTMEKIYPVFKDGKAFKFDEESIEVFAENIKKVLPRENLEILFNTGVDIAIADGILDLDTEMDFLKKMHVFFAIEKDINELIETRAQL